MLRKLLLVGIFAGASASVPILYQSNPDNFHALLQRQVQSDTKPRLQPRASNPAKSPAKPATIQLQGRKVRVTVDDRGHFVADFKLNGRRVEALVDTGATLVAINVSTARQVGIALKPSDFSYRVNTANGEVQAAVVNIGSIQLGRITVSDVQAFVLEDAALTKTLVGMSFLNRLNSFSVQDGALLLIQ